MKVVIDARWIFAEISGIGLYIRELIRALARIDHDTRYTLLFRDAAIRERILADTGADEAPNFEACRVDDGVFSPAGQVRLPRLLRRMQPEVYHSPNYLVPLAAFPRSRRGPTGCVVTLHDAIPLAHPEHAPRSRKRRLFPVYRALMKEIGRRADMILTVSEASRGELIRHLGLPASRERDVVAIHNGVGEIYRPPARPAAPHPPTVLYVGRFDPYKNLVVLIEAMARVREQVPGARLRVIGPPDPRYPEAPQRAAALGLAEAVEWTGYTADAELVRAYQDADVLALPSRYEGFGLPVVEAMACGTPVVCGNRSSLPEVAGDAALLVDPDDAEALAGALTRVLTDPPLASRLAEAGLARAAAFTWSNCARQTLAVYRAVAERRRH